MELPYRPRRLRRREPLRRLVRETHLRPDDFIYPLFVAPGKNIKEPIAAMPGVHRWSVDNVAEEVKAAWDVGVPAVLLFGLPEHKDDLGSEAGKRSGIVQRAIKEIKKSVPDILVITDVCLCGYTSHGHCGVVHGGGFTMTAIMSYAVKYASGFYGPFREAAESAPKFGDRRSYQMDPANVREAFREAALDVEEGADIIMVKPALPYLDVISQLRGEIDQPLAAYQVSGEYSMIKAAAANGWLDEKTVMLESLLSIKRAGADMILTYFAKEASHCLG